ANHGVVAYLADVSVENLARDSVNGDLGRLVHLHVDDVGFIHLHLGGDDRHVGQRHQGGAGRILDADHDGFAFAHREIGDDAVEGRVVDGLAQDIAGAGERGRRLVDAALGGLLLRALLRDARLRLVHAGDGSLVGGLPGVVILLGDELLLEQALGTVEVESRALQVAPGAVEVGLRGAQRGVGGLRVGARHLQRGLVGRDVGGGLHVLQLRQQLAFLHVVAFLHIQLHDLAEGVGAEVDVGLGLDFARGGHHRVQVFHRDFAGLHGNNALLALLHGESDDHQQRQDNPADNGYLLQLHDFSTMPAGTRIRQPLREYAGPGKPSAGMRLSLSWETMIISGEPYPWQWYEELSVRVR